MIVDLGFRSHSLSGFFELRKQINKYHNFPGKAPFLKKFNETGVTMLETLYGLHFHEQFLSCVVGLLIAEHGPVSFLTSYLDGVVTSDSVWRPIFPFKKENYTRSITQHERGD